MSASWTFLKVSRWRAGKATRNNRPRLCQKVSISAFGVLCRYRKAAIAPIKLTQSRNIFIVFDKSPVICAAWGIPAVLAIAVLVAR